MDYRKDLTMEERHDFMVRDIIGLRDLLNNGKIGKDANSIRLVKRFLNEILKLEYVK